MKKSDLACVIFDMDGTITSTNRLIFEAFNHIVERYVGERWTDAQIIALFGPPEEGALEAVVGPEHVADAMKLYLAYYREHHAEMASTYSGIPEILHDLQSQGIRLALFTGKGRFTTEITLEQFGLSKFFSKVVTGNDVVEHKPSGEGIRLIMSELSVSPAGTIMVGDSVADIRAARDAGIRVVSVLWDSYGMDRVLRESRDYSFTNVKDFGTWIRSAAGSNGR